MWTIIKFDKKKYNFLINDIKNKFGNNFTIYFPELTIQNYHNNQLKERNINLLGDYLFCFHSKFESEKNAFQLKFSRGVKLILNGYRESQIEIKTFIKNLKKLENENGKITQCVYETEINKNYKFTSGPFTQKIFKIIHLNKYKIDILINNLKTRINRKDFLFKPV